MVYVTAPSVQERSRECKDSRDLSRLQPYTFASSRRDRYLGMTAAIPQVPVPTASIAVAATAEYGKDRTYNLAVLIANQRTAKS